MATGINSHGDIVGFYEDAQFRQYGFLFADGHFTTLDVPSNTLTVAWGINDQNQIVGWFQTAQGAAQHAFVYEDGYFTTIDVPGSRATESYGINNRGQLVGWYLNTATEWIGGFIATPQ